MLEKNHINDDQIETFLKNEKSLKDQICSLTGDFDYLKSRNDQNYIIIVELEAKIEYLESKKSDLEDKLEILLI